MRPFSEVIVGPGQEPGKDVPYLYHSAGTKEGWGGLATSHSAYNEDATYTFRFKPKCEVGDGNCLKDPAGPFDVAARYYLPEPEIMSGEWTMPRPGYLGSE